MIQYEKINIIYYYSVFTKYAKCNGVSTDYSPAVNKIEGVLTFNRMPEA